MDARCDCEPAAAAKQSLFATRRPDVAWARECNMCELGRRELGAGRLVPRSLFQFSQLDVKLLRSSRHCAIVTRGCGWEVVPLPKHRSMGVKFAPPMLIAVAGMRPPRPSRQHVISCRDCTFGVRTGGQPVRRQSGRGCPSRKDSPGFLLPHSNTGRSGTLPHTHGNNPGAGLLHRLGERR